MAFGSLTSGIRESDPGRKVHALHRRTTRPKDPLRLIAYVDFRQLWSGLKNGFAEELLKEVVAQAG